jgi:hypothetical protein
MKAFSYAAVAALAFAASAAPVSAKVIKILIKNVGGIDDRGDFEFVLDDERTPDIVTATSVRYAAVNGGTAVPVSYTDVPGLGSGTVNTGVTFFTQTGQGGLAIAPFNGGQFRLFNTTLFTNSSFNTQLPRSQNKPTFKLGTFELSTTAANNGPRPSDNYRINISAVPEPATWAMMLAGFGALGLASRRRGTRSVLA